MFKLSFTDGNFIENSILFDIEPYFAYETDEKKQKKVITNKIEGYIYKIFMYGTQIKDVIEFKVAGDCKLKEEEYKGKKMIPVKLTGVLIKPIPINDDVKWSFKFDKIEVIKTQEAKAFDVLFNK